MNSTPSSLPARAADLDVRVDHRQPASEGAGSMTDAEYEVLVTALAEAARVFNRHQGALSAGDLRARSLITLAEKEATRARLETGSRNRRQSTEMEKPENAETCAAS